MAKNEIKTMDQPKTGAVVAAMDPELAALIAGDSGMGKENIKASDMAIPRLSILQPSSPQVMPGKPEYLESAKTGMIYDSVQNVCYSGEKGLIAIPVSFRSAYLEWIPHNKGGGFIADHGTDESVLKNCKQDSETKMMLTPEGHEIVLTAEYFSFIMPPDGGLFPVIISMAKTQHRKSRVWNFLINQFEIPNPANPEQRINPAMFYRSYKLTTVLESNDKGSWFGWKIEPGQNTFELPDGRNLYLRARKFHADIASGIVKAAAPVEMAGGGSAEDDNAPM